MSKHTPGPWINCQAVGQRLSSRRIISDSNKISTVVADVPDYGKTSASERHANARLIAAAPDLLEALTRAEDYLRNCCGSAKIANFCKAAIAKATGESA